MSVFDPNAHSLSHVVPELRRSLSPGLNKRAADDLVVCRLIEQFGFPLPEDLSSEDLELLVEADRSGQRRIWSDQRDNWDDEAEMQAYYEEQEEEILISRRGVEEGPPYRVVYADPPWRYDSKKAGGSMTSGSAQHYNTMSVGEIAALPIRSLAHPDGSALFLWGTVPMQPECWQVFHAWGFSYKTTIYWIKDAFDEATHEISNGRFGMGSWFRGQVEYCLVGVKGDVKAFRCQRKNYVFAKSTKHSTKPVEVRRLIQIATTELGGPRVELFSRDLVRGWDHWGDEVFSDLKLIDGAFVKKERS